MENYISLLMFTFATTITPGPNNLMLLASGVNHGIKSSLPHYFGISFGFISLVIMVTFGLGSVLMGSPGIFLLIKTLGVSYLLFLAWKIANAGRLEASEATKEPLSFSQSATFQFVNPKTWMMAVGAIATFVDQGNIVNTGLMVVGAFLIIGFVSQGAWLIAGQALKQFLGKGKRGHMFNIAMSVLLVLSIIPMIF